jgi:sulfatase maturation enzyme AslB (radical SAM superfamily)
MKVFLIVPPLEDFFFTPSRAYPLGALYLATVLKEAGLEAKVLNSLEENRKSTLKVPEKFSYLRRYYNHNKSPFCLFSNYYHFGLTYAEIEGEIKKFSPDVVGISSNFSPYFDCAYKVAKVVKKANKNIVVVLGGRFPTVLPRYVLQQRYIDFVIRGEAEFSFLELCKSIYKGKINKIDGLCYKTNAGLYLSSKIPIIGDLDILPFPKRDLINYTSYRHRGMVTTAIISSRGCNLGCRFCAIKEKFRKRSAQNVFREIRYCYDLGIRHFNFEDDNINLNPEFEKILDLIIKDFEKKIKVSFMNGLLSLRLSNHIREKLIKSGITHLDLSLVSSQKILREGLRRKEQKKGIFSLVNWMAEKRIATTVHFITAFPYQEFRDALRDLKYLAEKKVFLGISIFYPVIESGLFRELKRRFSVQEKDYAFFRSSCAYFDRFMSRDEVFFIFYLSRIINFLKELIDKFSLKENSFYPFLQTVTNDFNITNNALVMEKKLSRSTLGVILLRKLLEEAKAFRVEEYREDNRFYYLFIEESFISFKNLRRVFKTLKVKGVSSDSFIKIKGVPL